MKVSYKLAKDIKETARLIGEAYGIGATNDDFKPVNNKFNEVKKKYNMSRYRFTNFFKLVLEQFMFNPDEEIMKAMPNPDTLVNHYIDGTYKNLNSLIIRFQMELHYMTTEELMEREI